MSPPPVEVPEARGEKLAFLGRLPLVGRFWPGENGHGEEGDGDVAPGRGRRSAVPPHPADDGQPEDIESGDPPPVDPRIRARRQDIHEARRARRLRRSLVVSIVATVIALLYGATRSSLLDVDDIVVTGAEHTPVDHVQQAASVRVGQPLVEVDTESRAAAVRALPWVQSAEVRRSWWGTIDVMISERRAEVALEAPDGTWLLVDGDRRVLARERTQPDALLVVRGVPPKNPGEVLDAGIGGAIALNRALTPGLRTRVRAVQVSGSELDLAVLPTGTARFGTVDQLDEKLLALRTVYGQVDLTRLCLVDVRVPDQPVLTRKEPCA